MEIEEQLLPKEFKSVTLRDIDLGIAIKDITVALRVKVDQEENDKTGVLVQLYPTLEECLPPNLKLTMLSKSDKVVQEVPSREADNLIQLRRFKGKPGQIFKIQLSLGDTSFTEEFEC